MFKMNTIAVLITCHNRKSKTLVCLNAVLLNKLSEEYILEVFLVDDGSTDGTGNAVSETYPQVHIIKGDGSLFWNGGMRMAWRHALSKGYDFYLWLNDDSLIYSDAVIRVVETYQHLTKNGLQPGAVLGTMVDPSDKQPTYGGRLRNSRFNLVSFGSVIQPGSEPLACDFINGNFTLIPSAAVTKIGILSDAYTHSIGDFDYGFRLQNAGLTCWVAPGIFGECKTNSEYGGCKDYRLSIAQRVKKMQQPSQLPPVNEWIHYVRLHGGGLWPLLCIKAWVRGMFPHIWVFLRSKRM